MGAFGITALLLGGCTVGPKYVRPTAEVPSDYKEAANFKTAQPNDASAKGKWWEVYGDPQLNSLEEQVSVSNQTLKAAQAQFLEARAAVRTARAGYFPDVTAGASVSANRQSQNKALFGTGSQVNYNDFELPPVDVAYEPDVWGRVRRTVEAARSEAQASAADLASTDLSLHAELALDYFQLRGLDSQKQLLDSTVVSYEKALELTQSRLAAQISPPLDVERAETQLDAVEAQASDLKVQRSALENAIAALIGESAASFTISVVSRSIAFPRRSGRCFARGSKTWPATFAFARSTRCTASASTRWWPRPSSGPRSPHNWRSAATRRWARARSA